MDLQLARLAPLEVHEGGLVEKGFESKCSGEVWWRKQKEVEAALVLNPVLPRLSGGEDGQWNASREEKRDF